MLSMEMYKDDAPLPTENNQPYPTSFIKISFTSLSSMPKYRIVIDGFE
jgi:hypothetical protein